MKKRAFIAAALFSFSLAASAADIDASWDAVTLDEQGQPETVRGYILYWGRTSRPGNVQRPSDLGFSYDTFREVGNVTQSRQSGFEPGETYYFAVVAVDVAGNVSAYSSEVAATIPVGQDGGIDGGGEDGGGEDGGGEDGGGEDGGVGDDAGADSDSGADLGPQDAGADSDSGADLGPQDAGADSDPGADLGPQDAGADSDTGAEWNDRVEGSCGCSLPGFSGALWLLLPLALLAARRRRTAEG